MATILNDEFPPEVFTDASLAAVGEGMEFFPAYATLKSSLERFRPTQRLGVGQAAEFLPKWLNKKIMENCGDQPGPMLTAWLDRQRIEE